MDNDERLTRLEDALLTSGYQVAALQTILIDVLAIQCMGQPDPEQFAKAYRERFRNMLAKNPEPHEPDEPAYSEIVSGERADAVDGLLGKVVGTVRKRLAQRKQQ